MLQPGFRINKFRPKLFSSKPTFSIEFMHKQGLLSCCLRTKFECETIFVFVLWKPIKANRLSREVSFCYSLGEDCNQHKQLQIHDNKNKLFELQGSRYLTEYLHSSGKFLVKVLDVGWCLPWQTFLRDWIIISDD